MPRHQQTHVTDGQTDRIVTDKTKSIMLSGSNLWETCTLASLRLACMCECRFVRSPACGENLH